MRKLRLRKFKLAETSCLQLIEWDLNPGLPDSDVRMVSGNMAIKEGLSPLTCISKPPNPKRYHSHFQHPQSRAWQDAIFLSVVCAYSFSCVWLSTTLWTVAHQPPLSMGFSRQEYWSGLPCPPPGGLPNPGIKPSSPSLQADYWQPQRKPSVPSQLTFSTIFVSSIRWRIATVLFSSWKHHYSYLRWAYSLFCLGWNQLMGSI